MSLEGRICRLRAVEPHDIDTMYAWENDTSVWGVSGTTTPFSRFMLERFIDEQQFDIFRTRQLRLMIENKERQVVGAVDLFEFEPLHLRAGVGILIHDTTQRGKGYASDALMTLCAYAQHTLHLHQLWCNVGISNLPSMALFRNAGFVEAGVRKEWNRIDQAYEDEVMMQKLLRSN